MSRPTRQQPQSPHQEVLAGLVERVTFHNSDNGFCVLRAKARGHRDLVTVVGHAAIISAGYSTGLGFVHTGKMLAFVYDIADLYKVEIAVPAAFQAVAQHGESGIETHVRRACRDLFHERRLLDRIIPDIDRVLSVRRDADDEMDGGFAALPGGLWDPVEGSVAGGRNWADDGKTPGTSGLADPPP